MFALVAICAATNAETVTLSFSGETTEGRYCLLDSVHIENLTQNWVQTLDCSADTTFELPVTQMPTGIDNVSASNENSGLLSVSQNFIMGTTSLTINPLTDGVVHVRVIDMMGRIVIEHVEYLSAGYHQYALQLGSAQTYMLSVITDTEHAATKILNLTSFGNFDLSRVSSIPAIYQAPARRQTSAEGGDLMQYTGYTNQKGIAVASELVTQTQSSPERIVLRFAPVVKSTEGMYVSMMGFNNALYTYPFDILTSSNLYTHQQFVSNLSMASGTILYHAVYTSLDNIVKAPVPEKLQNVSIVTFTDGLDVNSWRMNHAYPSEALYLAAVNNQIHRTYIDGIKLDAYAIGVKGGDVTDEVRFESDLHQLASDSANVFNVSNMEEVHARFREIAAKIYNTKVNYSLTIKLAAPEPGSIIRFTFDNVSDANNSIYYIEGTYDFDWNTYVGTLKNVNYSGVKCSNGTTWVASSQGIFDIFTIYNLSSNLGERISTTNMKQWIYVPSSDMWQINSEFDASTSATTTEERTSAIVGLVLDCSSSLGSEFSNLQNAAKTFLSILAGKGGITKPSISAVLCILGDLQATLSAHIINTGNLQIIEKGFCVSEKPNMDNPTFYSCDAGEDNFEYLISGLTDGKTYYVRPYAENQLGRTYGEKVSFVAGVATIPTVLTLDITDITINSAYCSGEVVSANYSEVIERGFCLSQSPNPTINDSVVVISNGVGQYSTTLENLNAGSTYYIRAYAINGKGVGYGEEKSFTLLPVSQITYTAPSKLTNISDDFFDLPILSHTFNNGIGIITFTGLITSIGDNTFSRCSDISSITIPSCVTSIGIDAFEVCTGLRSVHINDLVAWCNISFANGSANPLSYANHLYLNDSEITTLDVLDDVPEIKNYAFLQCLGLTSVNIGNSVKSIGDHAFDGCSEVTSIIIGDSVTNIGNYAFAYCHTITEVTIPNSVKSIGERAFQACRGLSEIIIPDSVTSVGNWAFDGCSGVISICWNAKKCEIRSSNYLYAPFYGIRSQITSFTFGEGVESIPKYLCYDMKSLTTITIPSRLKSIGANAFYGCSNLKNITWNAKNYDDSFYISTSIFGTQVESFLFGEGVETIPARICYNMNKLTEIIIPNSVTNIRESAFDGCSGLTSITIPERVATIEDYAFLNCSGLTSVYNRAIIPQNIDDFVFTYANIINSILYVPQESMNAYQTTAGWQNFGSILPISE